MDYIDDAVESVNRWEQRRDRVNQPPQVESTRSGKVLIGKVYQFFDKINVAAINLTGALKVGDIIEIGNKEEAIRQKVSSMQIEREDILEAQEGASIGIKLKYKVPVGSDVYLLTE